MYKYLRLKARVIVYLDLYSYFFNLIYSYFYPVSILLSCSVYPAICYKKRKFLFCGGMYRKFTYYLIKKFI